MKYFFFDIDGTLTDIHTGKMVPSALKTLRLLEKAGHFTAICTGRAYYKTLNAAKEAGLHNFVANGGAALIINDELIRNAPLDREKALQIIHEAEDAGFGILVSPEDSIKVIMKNDLFLKQAGERKEPTEYVSDPSLVYEEIENIYKFYISVPAEREHELRNLDLLGHIRFEKEYLCYQHDEKDQGITDMIQYLGGSLNDVVVFGDGENDMVMFHEEWTKIAMGNGFPALLEKADYVTEAAENDGIEKACRHFGWID